MDKAIGIRVDAVMQERLRILSVVLSKGTSELVRSALEVLLEKHKDEIDAIIRVQKRAKQ